MVGRNYEDRWKPAVQNGDAILEKESRVGRSKGFYHAGLLSVANIAIPGAIKVAAITKPSEAESRLNTQANYNVGRVAEIVVITTAVKIEPLLIGHFSLPLHTNIVLEPALFRSSFFPRSEDR